jgi:hypothetical protein
MVTTTSVPSAPGAADQSTSREAPTRREQRATRRELLFGVTGVVLGVVAAMIGLAQWREARLARPVMPTQVIVYSTDPIAARQGLHVLPRTQVGDCQGHSIDSNRIDAYRCFVGHEIHDPCFATGDVPSHDVLCPEPWAKTIVAVRDARGLPWTPPGTDPPSPLAGHPWMLDLSNGARCSFADGASGMVGGLRVNYVCDYRRGANPGLDRIGGELIGDPDRSGVAWTILFGATHGTNFSPVRVERAWF